MHLGMIWIVLSSSVLILSMIDNWEVCFFVFLHLFFE